MGICEGAPSTAHSSFDIVMNKLSLRWDVSSVSAITLDVSPENSFQVETTSVPPQTFSKYSHACLPHQART